MSVAPPCSDEMTLVSTYPKEPSSGESRKEGLSDADASQWIPDGDDQAPCVTVTVDDKKDVFIDQISVSSTENVVSVTIVILTQTGQAVRC